MSPHKQCPVTGFSVIAARPSPRSCGADAAMNAFQLYAEMENAARCGGVAVPIGLKHGLGRMGASMRMKTICKSAAIAAAVALIAIGSARADDDQDCDHIQDELKKLAERLMNTSEPKGVGP